MRKCQNTQTHSMQALYLATFYSNLRTVLFSRGWVRSASEQIIL